MPSQKFNSTDKMKNRSKTIWQIYFHFQTAPFPKTPLIPFSDGLKIG